MSSSILPDCFEALASLPEHQKTYSKNLAYGTAGFREVADELPLDAVFFRMGALAAARSRVLGGKVMGVMITASHNPEPDNGVKMIEPNGGMLVADWEELCEKVANADDVATFRGLIEKTLEGCTCKAGVVFVGCDTRSSSQRLLRCVCRGVAAVGGYCENWGELTTPALHHIVRQSNGLGHDVSLASKEGFVRMFNEGFRRVTAGVPAEAQLARGPVLVDAAGGVGFEMVEKVAAAMSDILTIVPRNGPATPGLILNHECGAEYVQKGRCPPKGAFSSTADAGHRIASLDGDADRLVYSFWDVDMKWHLLDGDKIAALLAEFIQTQLNQAGLKDDDDCQFAAVQTAYANGNSGRFIRNKLGARVELAKTGVKFVEAVAHEYPIGMYFEANGHGTVVFKPEALAKFNGILADDKASKRAKEAASRLLGLSWLINQAVGDAISDFLAVEAVLTVNKWSIGEWDAMYEDLPSRQGKIYVKDRTVVKCTADETAAYAPEALQPAIDALVAKKESGRAFVRPSGTEDAVRIYAEAKTEKEANELAFEVAKATYEIVGGAPGKPAPVAADYGL
ncbi:Phosphoglucomutase-3 [Perkinsus chesapeaki]|uniref:Phosphoacetylglucosamine mutase n=1 Tax=Perkinsus chesapeaki TaxID=330153 RepID=A0A7J6MRM3_PERCH|nr:Phosphoglucomutase-3 [Perkinsus chesapeaki]